MAVVPHGVYFDVLVEQRQCQMFGANIADSPSDAGLVVVKNLDPTSMNHRTLWAAMLVGAFALAKEDFMTVCRRPRSRVAVLKYDAAVFFWRRIHITNAFKTKHSKLVRLVETVCQKPSSKWKLLDTIQEINAEWLAAKKKGKSGQVVVLASKGEQVVTPAKVMTFMQFQSSINKVDATRTVSSSEAARVQGRSDDLLRAMIRHARTCHLLRCHAIR